MPVVDIIIVSLTIFSSLLGLSRGFVKEFFSLTKLLISLYVSYISLEKTKSILSTFLKDSPILDLIAGGSVFLLVFFLLSIIFNFITKIVDLKSFSFLDKGMGLIFGFARMIVILSLISIIYSDLFYNEEKPQWFTDSFTIEYIEKVSIYLEKKFLDINLNNDIIT